MSSLVWLAAMAGCTGSHEPQDSVVVAVMDGVRLEESFGDNESTATGELPVQIMPSTWATLVRQGARATAAYNVGATITGPAHCDMLSGRRQAFANYSLAPGEDPGVYRPEVPMILQEMRESTGWPAEATQLTGNTELIAPLTYSLWPGDADLGSTYTLVGQTDDPTIPSVDDNDVSERMGDILENERPRFLLANLHDVDREGHYGPYDGYTDGVGIIDAFLPKLWDTIQGVPEMRDHTWLVVVADHGRHHVSDTDPPWRNHGDECSGCRRIPLLIVGPGVRQGISVDTPATLEDVAATVSALLGVDAPWSEGIPLSTMFDDGLAGGPTGVADLAVAGGHRLQVEYQDDSAQRKVVSLDGEIVSDPAALVAEAPAMATSADGAHALACWREIVVSTALESMPWVGHCLWSGDGGATWSEAGWPDDHVGPYWTAAIAPLTDGSLIAVYPHNPNGITTPGLEGDTVGVRSARYDGTGWTTGESESQPSFPTDPTATWLDGSLGVAVAAGNSDDDTRNSRRVYFTNVAVDGGTPTMPLLRSYAFSSLSDGEFWRIERPALGWVDGVAWLAFVGTSENGTKLGLARSGDQGVTWAEATPPVGSVGETLPNVQPVWAAGRLAWATYDAGTATAYVCTAPPDLGTATCTDIDSPRIQALRADGDLLYAVVDGGIGSWQVAEVIVR